MTHPTSFYPPALKKGDTIGVIAPSGAHDLEKLQPGIDVLRARGYNVVLHPQTSLKHNQFAGTVKDKVQALHDYFSDSSIKAIFCTSGGNGVLHYLDLIDYSLIKKNHKIFIGFSDITLILNAIYAKTGLVTFHGPTLTRLPKIESRWLEQMFATLTGKSGEIDLKFSSPSMEGTLIGGNLSVTQALIGTAYAPPLKNALLLLEDINDHYSRYDRMIVHMKLAGWFQQISGIILGDFLNSQDNPERPFGLSVEDMLKTHAPHIPYALEAPFGHGDQLCTLPIGAHVVLKNGKLSFKSLT